MNSIEFNSLENSRNCYVNYRGNTSLVCNIDKVEGLLEILLKDNEKADDFESVWVRYENCEIEPCANFSNTKEFHDLRKTF